MMYKIAIFDPNPVTLAGIKHWLTQLEDVEIAFTFDTIEAAIGELKNRDSTVDLLLADLGSLLAPICKMKLITKNLPGVRTVIFSEMEETRFAKEFVKAGAFGFVRKSTSFSDFEAEIRKVLVGKISLSPEATESAVQEMLHPPKDERVVTRLTERQIEIVKLIGKGLSSRAIATELQRSIKTVEAHKMHIRERLGLASTHDLYLFSCRLLGAENANTAPIVNGNAPVLYVDEDRSFTWKVQRVCNLLSLPNRYLVTRSGGSGLRMIEGLDPRPSLVLVDLLGNCRSEMNGIEFLTELKKKFGSIPVVFFSDSKDENVRMLAFELGASGFINKPDNEEEMISVLRTISSYWSINRLQSDVNESVPAVARETLENSSVVPSP